MLREGFKTRMAALVVSAGLVMGLCACGGGAATTSEAEAPAAEESQVAEESQAAVATKSAPKGASSGESADSLTDHDATVYTADGTPTTLADLAAGKPLVINFWATWCPYCVDELPDFEQIVADYGGRVNFAFIDSVDGETETVEGSKAWLAENGHTGLPVYFDSDGAAGNAFALAAYPTTVIVGPDGKIVTVTEGRIDAAAVRQTLDSIA